MLGARRFYGRSAKPVIVVFARVTLCLFTPWILYNSVTDTPLANELEVPSVIGPADQVATNDADRQSQVDFYRARYSRLNLEAADALSGLHKRTRGGRYESPGGSSYGEDSGSDEGSLSESEYGSGSKSDKSYSSGSELAGQNHDGQEGRDPAKMKRDFKDCQKRGRLLHAAMLEVEIPPEDQTPYSNVREADLKRMGFVQADPDDFISKQNRKFLDEEGIPSGINNGWESWKRKHQNAWVDPQSGKTKTPTNAIFAFVVNVKHGVIVINKAMTHSYFDKNTANHPPIGHLSDMVWTAWASLCKDNENAMAQIRYVLMDDAENLITRDTLRDERSPQSICEALLGTPNGSGVGWFLTQHKAILGKKRTVESVRAWIYYDKTLVEDTRHRGPQLFLAFKYDQYDAKSTRLHPRLEAGPSGSDSKRIDTGKGHGPPAETQPKISVTGPKVKGQDVRLHKRKGGSSRGGSPGSGGYEGSGEEGSAEDSPFDVASPGSVGSHKGSMQEDSASGSERKFGLIGYSASNQGTSEEPSSTDEEIARQKDDGEEGKQPPEKLEEEFRDCQQRGRNLQSQMLKETVPPEEQTPFSGKVDSREYGWGKMKWHDAYISYATQRFLNDRDIPYKNTKGWQYAYWNHLNAHRDPITDQLKPATGGHFIFYLNKEHGIIVITHEFSPGKATNRVFLESDLPALARLSDMMWMIWSDFCKDDHAVIASIKYVVIDNINNVKTRDVLRHGLGGSLMTKFEHFPGHIWKLPANAEINENDKSPQSIGEAVLGSPSGNGVGRFLTQHKEVLGNHRRVTDIQAWMYRKADPESYSGDEEENMKQTGPKLFLALYISTSLPGGHPAPDAGPSGSEPKRLDTGEGHSGHGKATAIH